MKESVIDFPKETLCQDIWQKTLDVLGIKEIWSLKPYVRNQLVEISNYIIQRFTKFKCEVHITGSITSNSYTSKADIDLHFICNEALKTKSSEQINNEIKQIFKQFKIEHPEKAYVKTHPIEVFFQENEFQDYMSIGCYDLFNNKWLIGPEFTNINFNPYKEYYKDIQNNSENIFQQIRNMIFSIYELAIICKKNINTDFYVSLRTILVERLSNIQELYDNMHNIRKTYSAPKSKEEAIEFRQSRKWKIADATFKLLDKYGYIAILRQFIQDFQLLYSSKETDIEIIENLLATVKHYIYNADKLSEQELYEGLINEDGLFKTLAIASLLAIPGLIPEQALAKELSNIPRQELRFNSKAVNKAIDKVALEKQTFGNLSFVNLVNLIATIAYNETMIDYIKYNDPNIIYAIVQLISNRAGGDFNNIPKVISTPSQFFSFKHVINKDLTNKSYVKYDPHKEGSISKKQEKAWKLCNEAAVMLLKNKLPNVIGDRNMLANKKIDNKKSYNAWGKKCDLKIGSQQYGYQKDQDGYLKYKTEKPKYLNHNQVEQKIYIVKKGDNLTKIAKTLKTTVKKLAKLNNLKINGILKIGQKLKYG